MPRNMTTEKNRLIPLKSQLTRNDSRRNGKSE